LNSFIDPFCLAFCLLHTAPGVQTGLVNDGSRCAAGRSLCALFLYPARGYRRVR
jgi:hypothetical protein